MKHKPEINRGRRISEFLVPRQELSFFQATGISFGRLKMNTKPCIVMGEAQESESEEEIDSSAISTDLIEHCKGNIVFGEAPESDEECCANTGSMESISSAASALSAPTMNERKRKSRKHQSVLAKKLYERNASLYKNLTEFVEQTAINAGNELNAANKKLLKCQLQVQEGADYLKVINSNLSALDANLEMLLSTNYLPNIRIKESPRKEELKS